MAQPRNPSAPMTFCFFTFSERESSNQYCAVPLGSFMNGDMAAGREQHAVGDGSRNRGALTSIAFEETSPGKRLQDAVVHLLTGRVGAVNAAKRNRRNRAHVVGANLACARIMIPIPRQTQHKLARTDAQLQIALHAETRLVQRRVGPRNARPRGLNLRLFVCAPA